jgi:hypothetical protein
LWTIRITINHHYHYYYYYYDYYYFPLFCRADFPEIAGQIFLKHLGKVHYINTSGISFHLSKIHFRSVNMVDFLFLKSFCPAVFSETVKDRVMKFSRFRPKVMKEIKNFKFCLLYWNLYHNNRFLFKCLKQLTPPEGEASTSGHYKKKFQILNFQCLKSSLLLKCFTWNWYML